MNASLTTRLGFFFDAAAVTLALLSGVGTMTQPNSADAWMAKAPVAAKVA